MIEMKNLLNESSIQKTTIKDACKTLGIKILNNNRYTVDGEEDYSILKRLLNNTLAYTIDTNINSIATFGGKELYQKTKGTITKSINDLINSNEKIQKAEKFFHYCRVMVWLLSIKETGNELISRIGVLPTETKKEMFGVDKNITDANGSLILTDNFILTMLRLKREVL